MVTAQSDNNRICIGLFAHTPALRMILIPTLSAWFDGIGLMYGQCDFTAWIIGQNMMRNLIRQGL